MDNAAFAGMFREYDIRGRLNENELTDDSIYLIVSAYARFLRDRSIKSAIIGYDNRKCSEGFAEAAINALSDWGIKVIFIGLCVTPAVYYAQHLYKCEGAVPLRLIV